MFTFKTTRYALLCLLVAIVSRPASSERDGPQVEFVLGAEQITANCGDCMGATEAALLDGVRKVEHAIAKGYPDLNSALKALAEGYRTYQYVWAKPASADAVAARSKRTSIYAELVKLSPTDASVRYEYAELLDTPKEQIQQLRIALSVNALHGLVPYRLGLLLVEQGSTKEGVAMLLAAIDMSPDQANAKRYAARAEELLSGRAAREELNQIRRGLNRRLQKQN
jgi:predicted Zn-dependent protease